MEQSQLLDAHVQMRKMYNLLGEVQDLSRQLADAVNRNDEVTMQLLLSMRQEPVQELVRVRSVLREQAESAAQKGNGRLRELLNGADAQEPEERGLANQVAMNQRLLVQIQEMERHLNRKIARDQSMFNM